MPERLLLRFGTAFTQEGFKVVVPFQDPDRAELLKAKIVDALLLIRSHTPKHYARFRKFIPNILILGIHPYNAVYIPDLKLCDISREFALSGSTGCEQMALMLVHEAAHGYLRSRGVPYPEAQRAQIERICVQAEVALARKLPQAKALVAEARGRLDYGPDYWTDESFLERQVDDHIKAGMPKFLIRRFQRFGGRRLGVGSEQNTQPGAPPNGGPANRSGNSGAGEGPPSVS